MLQEAIDSSEECGTGRRTLQARSSSYSKFSGIDVGNPLDIREMRWQCHGTISIAGAVSPSYVVPSP